MQYLIDLFKSAKNAVVSTASGVYSKFKKRAAEEVVRQFGPDVIEAGTEMVAEKVKDAIKLSSTKMMNAFAGLDESFDITADSSLERHFDGLLSTAKEQLSTFASGVEEPVIQAGVKIASGLLDTLDGFKNDCFKLKKKTLASFKKDSINAIKELQPTIEKALTSAIFDAIIGPFISFFANMLKSLFSVGQPKNEAPEVVRHEADNVEVNDADFDVKDDVEDMGYAENQNQSFGM